MITPTYGLTATERVLPRLALDWTTGLAQPGVDVTRAGVATFVDSDGVIQLASENTQRIDWSTGIPGLLIEEERGNELTHSEQFDNAAWVKNNSPIITSNSAIAPDGTLTADKISAADGVVGGTSNSNSGLRRAATYTAGVPSTSAIYAKAGEQSQLRVFMIGTGEGELATFDLANGTFDATSAASMTNVGNGWYRCSLTFTATTTFTSSAGFRVGGSGYTGNGVDGIYLWGAQLEVGAFATSYIPTEASAVTRNADVATMTGTNFSDWFNPDEGTFAITATRDSPPTAGKFPYSLYLISTSGNDINVYQNGATSEQTLIRVSNATQANLNTDVIAANTEFTQVAAYKADSFAFSTNASIVEVDNSGTVPTLNQLQIGSAAGGFQLNGRIAKIYYWPQRLINAEVQAFSK